jgi:hypothetical protein
MQNDRRIKWLHHIVRHRPKGRQQLTGEATVNSDIRLNEVARVRNDRVPPAGRTQLGQLGGVTGPLFAVAFSLFTLMAFLVWLLAGPPLPDWIRSR